MKLQNKLAVLFTILFCSSFAQESMAQPAGYELGAHIWRTPNIVNPQDVSIGSTTSIRTDDRYADFLRFSSPVDIDVRIEGDARWYPDPQAALFVMDGSEARQVASDDDGGPHRDFLIEHRLLANQTYILQVGTRTSTNTLVTITTGQIALHGQLGSHAPQSGVDLPVPSSGRRIEANWSHGTEFAPNIVFWRQDERNFTVQNFARNQSSFRIDEVSISPFEDPFAFRTTSAPPEHVDSFTATIVNDSEIKVNFRPMAEGLINATMVIRYSFDGRRFVAAVPLSGRGYMFYHRTHTQEVAGLGRSASSNFSYRISSNITQAEGPASMSLRFDAPVSNVGVVIIPKRGTGSKVSATLYDARYNHSQGQQLEDFGTLLFTYIPVTRQSVVNLKVTLPTEVDVSIAEFEVYVFANR